MKVGRPPFLIFALDHVALPVYCIHNHAVKSPTTKMHTTDKLCKALTHLIVVFVVFFVKCLFYALFLRINLCRLEIR
jgi:hypothetical protein